MRLLFIFLLAGSLAPRSIFAEHEGTSAASFLKLDSGARAASLAGAFTAVSDDANVINYNPAGLAGLTRKELTLSHNEWIGGMRQESMSYGHTLGGNLTVGLGVNYLFTESIPRTDISGLLTGDNFSGSGGIVALGFAERLSGLFMCGASAKIIRESLDDKSSIAYAGDAGVLIKADKLSIGLAAQNFGTSINLNDDAFPLPLTYRAGLRFEFMKDAFADTDVTKARDTALIVRIGLEQRISGIIIPEDAVLVRVGYKTGQSENAGPGFSAGAGIKIKDFQLDYGFAPYGELGSSHRISFTVRFGAAREEQDFDMTAPPRWRHIIE